MAACAYRHTCRFFSKGRLDGFSGIAGLFEARYCGSDYTSCMRYQIAEARGFDSVPSDMYPNDVARARNLRSTAV
ncbi:MAG: hypothetical protein OEV43_04270 [Coriobacteriia bacterium]|nr:hypothetical protein [Coriobacteriia bacterium]